MRISDWSSDVCSSDLPDGPSSATTPPSDTSRSIPRSTSTGAAPVPSVSVRFRADIARDRLVTQIGRASCRERVCQYVQISAVAVSFKEKRHKQIWGASDDIFDPNTETNK